MAGPTLIAIPNLAATGDWVPAPSTTTDLGRRFGSIWELADAGASAETIARETGQPIGQVELILGSEAPARRLDVDVGGPAPAMTPLSPDALPAWIGPARPS